MPPVPSELCSGTLHAPILDADLRIGEIVVCSGNGTVGEIKSVHAVEADECANDSGSSKRKRSVVKAIIQKWVAEDRPEPLNVVDYKYALGVPELRETEEKVEVEGEEVVDVAVLLHVDEFQSHHRHLRLIDNVFVHRNDKRVKGMPGGFTGRLFRGLGHVVSETEKKMWTCAAKQPLITTLHLHLDPEVWDYMKSRHTINMEESGEDEEVVKNKSVKKQRVYRAPDLEQVKRSEKVKVEVIHASTDEEIGSIRRILGAGYGIGARVRPPCIKDNNVAGVSKKRKMRFGDIVNIIGNPPDCSTDGKRFTVSDEDAIVKFTDRGNENGSSMKFEYDLPISKCTIRLQYRKAKMGKSRLAFSILTAVRATLAKAVDFTVMAVAKGSTFVLKEQGQGDVLYRATGRRDDEGRVIVESDTGKRQHLDAEALEKARD